MSDLQDSFHDAMVQIYIQAQEACNYRAKAFLAMVVEQGGVVAAKKLLSTTEMQSGLFELFECGRLDLTVETLVLKDDYRQLFTAGELAEAERRLQTLQRAAR
jgi:hypothetical protein